MNLYVHFPFCRSKCAYCALASRAGSNAGQRTVYSERITRETENLPVPEDGEHTVYFGGGSPALCPHVPVLKALRNKGLLAAGTECTVELHPLDVTPETLESLRMNGVNRISLGVQTFNDQTLAYLNRQHTSAGARAAISAISALFPSCGIDIITGLPTPPDINAIADVLPLISHISVYTLIREPKTRLDTDIRRGRVKIPDDPDTLAEFAAVRSLLLSSGFKRYEIANFARPGFECRHNFAVWRGEDYTGLGDGAHGRIGTKRTIGKNGGYETEELSPESDALERALFSLRTSDGISLSRVREKWPVLEARLDGWKTTLDFHVSQGLLTRVDSVYRLTQRGAEVCDSIISDLL